MKIRKSKMKMIILFSNEREEGNLVFQGLPLIKQLMVDENETCCKISALAISTSINMMKDQEKK